jgi:hypothetical protein
MVGRLQNHIVGALVAALSEEVKKKLVPRTDL